MNSAPRPKHANVIPIVDARAELEHAAAELVLVLVRLDEARARVSRAIVGVRGGAGETSVRLLALQLGSVRRRLDVLQGHADALERRLGQGECVP